jgi:hypothetical protein
MAIGADDSMIDINTRSGLTKGEWLRHERFLSLYEAGIV